MSTRAMPLQMALGATDSTGIVSREPWRGNSSFSVKNLVEFLKGVVEYGR